MRSSGTCAIPASWHGRIKEGIMKKIRESFHMIAAAVFCLVMSVKATVLKEMGQAVGLSEGALGYVPGARNAAGNTTDSSMYRTASEHDNYIRKVFFWMRGPGDRSVDVLEGIPPIMQNVILQE